jgi:hypothetical protein
LACEGPEAAVFAVFPLNQGNRADIGSGKTANENGSPHIAPHFNWWRQINAIEKYGTLAASTEPSGARRWVRQGRALDIAGAIEQAERIEHPVHFCKMVS